MGRVLPPYGKHVEGAIQKEYWKTFITTPLDGNGLRTTLKYEKSHSRRIIWDKDKVYLIIKKKKKLNDEPEVINQ